MKLFIAKIKIIIHCLKNGHTDVSYSIGKKTLKLKCKECEKVFYENFVNQADKEYFENEIEKPLDEENNLQ